MPLYQDTLQPPNLGTLNASQSGEAGQMVHGRQAEFKMLGMAPLYVTSSHPSVVYSTAEVMGPSRIVPNLRPEMCWSPGGAQARQGPKQQKKKKGKVKGKEKAHHTTDGGRDEDIRFEKCLMASEANFSSYSLRDEAFWLHLRRHPPRLSTPHIVHVLRTRLPSSTPVHRLTFTPSTRLRFLRPIRFR
ncbi:hypothetical protein B0H14DRAFT_2636566 [Mycena olivaceomarginata]|nr:hypothetical protein B0H14DRAFT_2636566 [Mycena olivaceomarginata]